MIVNPYESPQAVSDEKPIPLPPRENGIGSAVALVLATIGGGLAGVAVGNAVARIFGMGMMPGRDGSLFAFFAIQHPLSLVLLVVGSFLGACVAIRLANTVQTGK